MSRHLVEANLDREIIVDSGRLHDGSFGPVFERHVDLVAASRSLALSVSGC
jgi:hypothetical protein